MVVQARRQDLAAGGAKNQKGEPIFKNTVLDVCSNRWTKREMGGTDFKWGPGTTAPPTGDGPVVVTVRFTIRVFLTFFRLVRIERN